MTMKEQFPDEHRTEHSDKTSQVINGDLRIGDYIVSVSGDEYGYLVGQVKEINKVGTSEHDTENPGDDIVVDFTVFEYSDERIAEIEKDFSYSYGEPKEFGDIALDCTIMAPDSLIRVNELGVNKITQFAQKREICENFCNSYPREDKTYDEKHKTLMERIANNLDDYHNLIMDFQPKEIIDMADRIAAKSEAYWHMRRYGYEEEELDFYLQFQNPLEVVGDAWLRYNSGLGDINDAMGNVYDKKDALGEYPLIGDNKTLADKEKPSVLEKLAELRGNAQNEAPAQEKKKSQEQER